MSRPGSVPASESIPPPPSGTSTEDRLGWLEKTARAAWKRIDLIRIDVHELRVRVEETEESLGEEGNEAKGRKPTGLHLALENARIETAQRFESVERELGAVLKAVQEVAAGLAADRAARESVKLVEAAKEEAITVVQAPRQKDLATARAALIGSAVTLFLGGIVALVLRHLVWR